MATLRLPVDWDELEIALTERLEDWAHYLDRRTGQVVTFHDGGESDVSEEEIDAGLAEGQLVFIEPLPSSVEYGWMQDFAASLRDADLRKLLAVALDGRGAFRRFKDILAERPQERESWFAFREERVIEAMREWLEDNGIEATAEPRRRPK